MAYVRRSESVSLDFFAYYMRSQQFRQRLEAAATGTTNSHVRLRPSETLNWLVPVPPLPEQRAIAAVLDAADAAIERTRSAAAARRLKRGLVQALLTHGVGSDGRLRDESDKQSFKGSPFGSIPKDWELVPLGKVADVNRGKFSVRPRNDPRYYGGLYPFIQTGDITREQGGVITTFTQTLNDAGTAVSRQFPVGTIAITIAANIADTAILGIPMYFPDSIVGALVHEPNVPRYIELCIRRAKLKLEAAAPQSAQKNINLEDLRPLLIPLPKPKEQRAIVALYESSRAVIAAYEIEIAAHERLKRGLMHVLLTGRVRVPVA